MRIKMAHLRERSRDGGWINFAVFEAKATDGDNSSALHTLTAAARNLGLRIDQSALAYRSGGQLRFFGSKPLVDYLSKNWIPHWTHTLDV